MAQILVWCAVGIVILLIGAFLGVWREQTRRIERENDAEPSKVNVVRVRHGKVGTLIVEASLTWPPRVIRFELPSAMAIDLGRALSVEGALSAHHEGEPEDERTPLGRPARSFSEAESERRAKQSEEKTLEHHRVMCPKCGMWWRYETKDGPPERCKMKRCNAGLRCTCDGPAIVKGRHALSCPMFTEEEARP